MLLQLVCTDQSLVKGPAHLAAGESYSVGRSSRCAFLLNDRSVSRRHAQLTPGTATILVKDLKSRNGTFVGGLKIVEAEVEVGQVICFGKASFQVITKHPQDGNDTSALSTFVVAVGRSAEQVALGQLSEAQRRVLDLLLTGRAEKEVAARLEVSPHTVHNHVKEIYRKMGVNSRPELLALFVSDAKKKTLGQ